jgi:peptide/nickel transport system permease protein
MTSALGADVGISQRRPGGARWPWTLLFIGRRLVAMAVLLLVVSFLVFALLYLAPGDAVQTLLGDQPSSPQLVATLRQRYHLDESFFDQYRHWLAGAAHLDFGESIRSGRSVAATIRNRLDLTLLLGLYAFVVAIAAGVPLGVVAACRKRTLVDRGAVGLSIFGVSAPAFVTAVFLLYVFAVQLAWFPVYGAGDGLLDRLWHLTLPAIALSLSSMALVVKLTRSAMISVLAQDYIAFARARGVPLRRVIFRHALRNALVPVITAGGLVLTVVIGGAVLVEVPFALPGLGALLVDAVQHRDVPMLQGVAMAFAATVIVINLAVDLLYAAVDPRIRFRRGPS